MPEMRAAIRTQHLFAAHSQTGVDFGTNPIRREGQPETGPSGAGIVFFPRAEKRRVAANTDIGPVCLVVDESPTKRRLGTLLLSHFELLGR